MSAGSAKPTLHIAFGISIAATMRQAFREIVCEERVIGCSGDLSFGPIDPPDPGQRAEWTRDNLFSDDEFDLVPNAEAFWAEATSADVDPVVWVCRNHPRELCGFLELVWRLAEAPLRVVDATDVILPQWHGSPNLWSLGVLGHERIVSEGLLQKQAAVSLAARTRFRETWQKLRAENAPVRVIDGRGLVSAPLTHFDAAIASCATCEWQKGARIVGETMAKLLEGPFAQCPGDILLWSRVVALGRAGALEVRGSGPDMRDHEVRRGRTTKHIATAAK